MKYYVDFEGWAIVEADSHEEAAEKFWKGDILGITYDNIDTEECSGS